MWDTDYRAEVDAWLGSEEASFVFNALKDKLIARATDLAAPKVTARAQAEELIRRQSMRGRKGRRVERRRQRKRRLMTDDRLSIEEEEGRYEAENDTGGRGGGRGGDEGDGGRGEGEEVVINVFVAGDNEQVKDAFVALIESHRVAPNASLLDPHPPPHPSPSSPHPPAFRVRVLRLRNDYIQHVRNLPKMKNDTDGVGLWSLAFDWYALSLSDYLLTWRR